MTQYSCKFILALCHQFNILASSSEKFIAQGKRNKKLNKTKLRLTHVTIEVGAKWLGLICSKTTFDELTHELSIKAFHSFLALLRI